MTAPPDFGAAIEVTQADREGAALLIEQLTPFLRDDFSWLLSAETMRRGHRGKVEHVFVADAFARHRTSTALPLAHPAAEETTTWVSATDDQRDRVTLLAEVELHLQSARIFITSREKMHPCGVDLHDELLAKVSAAIDAIGREKLK